VTVPSCKLGIRAIIFEVTQPIRPRCINVADRRTDETDGPPTIAIPRFALCASRRKNEKMV